MLVKINNKVGCMDLMTIKFAHVNNYGMFKGITDVCERPQCADAEDPFLLVSTDTDTVSVVTELPLVTQGYQIIDSYGPQGIANVDFCFRRGLSIDPYINRLVTKALIKQSKVFAITLDNSPVRTVM